jgi:hypothetical protein
MNEKTENTVTDLIGQFENPENSKLVKDVQVSDPLNELGRDLFSFFKQRIARIADIEDVKKIVLESLIKKMEANDEVTFTQLANFFINLSEQSSIASEQIVSLLKPTQASTSNPFASSITKDSNKDKMGQGLDGGYSPEMQRKADKVFRFFEALADRVPDKKE